MRILQNYDLTKFNTFGISVNAKFFVEINDEPDLAELFIRPEFKNNKKMFLGGGSNILFTENFDGIVVLNKLKGMEVLEENDETVLVRSMGGEIWQDLVMFAVNQGFWGVENLSYIPGTVGAAPMQNIGAYGVELKDTLLNVEAFPIEKGEENKKKIFSREECGLGYRDSVFKTKLKGKYFISAITLKLSKVEKKNINYKVLKEYIEKNKIKIHSPKDISDAVTAIRQSKLPDPKIIGNAGSFFKNVFVKKAQLEGLLKTYPAMSYFKEDGMIKIPAGWLIEQCGPASARQGGAGGTNWKGYREGNVGVHPKQALVLVNFGGATGRDILELAKRIITSVKQKFGLELVPEVNIM
jgi:UDP-N-acetylmuramate dehydrogenase